MTDHPLEDTQPMPYCEGTGDVPRPGSVEWVVTGPAQGGGQRPMQLRGTCPACLARVAVDHGDEDVHIQRHPAPEPGYPSTPNQWEPDASHLATHVLDAWAEVALQERQPVVNVAARDHATAYAMGTSTAAAIAGLPQGVWASPQRDRFVDDRIPFSRAIALVSQERLRQPTLGYDADHDREHELQLVQAGIAYGKAVSYLLSGVVTELRAPVTPWPWDAQFWKPSNRVVRTLVKAAALLVAAIDALLAKDEKP